MMHARHFEWFCGHVDEKKRIIFAREPGWPQVLRELAYFAKYLAAGHAEDELEELLKELFGERAGTFPDESE